MSAPKLFVSYSWSNSPHEQRVLELATELRQSGVDVILDKWDLKEGHDAVAFMERMVTDPEVAKVAIVCDETYATKADGREGGVGTETQIVSKEVYDKQAQDKFVAVVMERSPDGEPYLPTYYKSRIYIDLGEPDRYSDEFERLLRWIFNKPLYRRPELGTRPTFVSEGDHVSLGSTALFRRCLDGLTNHKAHAEGLLDEYCDLVTSNLERFRIVDAEGDFDEAVVKSIAEFLPYRNELLQVFTAVARHAPGANFVRRLHRLLESLVPYMNRPQEISSWKEGDFDNFRFVIHELFLCALGVFLKHERFDEANLFLATPYYCPERSASGADVMAGFSVFQEHLKSLEHRNNRMKLRRVSLRADLLKERCQGTGMDFRYLMQADFVAFMRAELESGDWWPETLIYVERFGSPFEIFARSVSKSYFARVRVVLGTEDQEALERLLASYQNNSRILPRWGRFGFSPATLIGASRLATMP